MASAGQDGDARDYGREAMVYFRDKMRAYGEGIEVPIKSLLGHRSQAPPEVRHVSGQHIREFKDFLLRYPEVFVLTEEDTIFLNEGDRDVAKLRGEKVADDSPRSLFSPTNGGSPPFPSMAVECAAEQLLERLKYHLRNRPAMGIRELLAQTTRDAESKGEQPAFGSPENLRTFLRLHPGMFSMRGSLVSLASTAADSPTPDTPPHSLTKSPSRGGSSTSLNASNSAISLKDRIGSVVKKAVEDNSASHSVANGNQSQMMPSSPPLMQQQPNFGPENVRVVADERSLAASIRVVRNWKVMAVEVKGLNLGPEGRLTSVHLGSPDTTSSPLIFVLDFTSLPPTAFADSGFKQLLEDESIVKVLHDCRNESATMWFQHNVMMANVFDTQVSEKDKSCIFRRFSLFFRPPSP